MKNIFSPLFLLISAICVWGCTTSEINADLGQDSRTIQFFADKVETKTAFGTLEGARYPTLWNPYDQVMILLNLEEISGSECVTQAKCSEDLKSARFEAQFSVNPDTYTYYAISPSSAYNKKSQEDSHICVSIPSHQIPLETSVDTDAMILYAETAASSDQLSVKLDFHHLTAYGKLSLLNITEEVTSISNIQIVAPEDVCISGKWYYSVSDGTISPNEEQANNHITIDTSRINDIWFACGPVDLSGKTIKFIVSTDKGDLIKEVTFYAERVFKSGHVSTFSLDMSGIEPTSNEQISSSKVYEKVVEEPYDWTGTYLIVFEGISSCWDGTLPAGKLTGQLGHTAGLKPIAIVDNKIEYNDSYFVIEKHESSYTIASARGEVIGNSGLVNDVQTDPSYTCDISMNDNGTVSIHASDGKTLVAYNGTGNNKFVRFYKTTTVANQSYPLPTLYKLNSIRITADKSRIEADGNDYITLTVEGVDDSRIKDIQFYDAVSNNLIEIDNLRFKTTVGGAYAIYAKLGKITSNTINILAKDATVPDYIAITGETGADDVSCSVLGLDGSVLYYYKNESNPNLVGKISKSNVFTGETDFVVNFNDKGQVRDIYTSHATIILQNYRDNLVDAIIMMSNGEEVILNDLELNNAMYMATRALSGIEIANLVVSGVATGLEIATIASVGIAAAGPLSVAVATLGVGMWIYDAATAFDLTTEGGIVGEFSLHLVGHYAGLAGLAQHFPSNRLELLAALGQLASEWTGLAEMFEGRGQTPSQIFGSWTCVWYTTPPDVKLLHMTLNPDYTMSQLYYYGYKGENVLHSGSTFSVSGSKITFYKTNGDVQHWIIDHLSSNSLSIVATSDGFVYNFTR